MKFFLSPKLCFALVLFCFYSSLFSQSKSAKELMDQGKKASAAFKYDSAVSYYLLAKEQYLLEKDTNMYYMAGVQISYEQARAGRFDPAMETAQNILTEGSSFLLEADFAYVYRSIAHVHNLSGNPEKNAIEYYNKALERLGETKILNDVKLKANINSDIAILNFNRSRYSIAEDYWKKSLDILKTLPKDSIALSFCKVSSNLAGVLKMRGAFNLAISTYEEAGEVATQYLENPDGMLSFVYDGIASTIRSSNTKSEQKALDYYTKALALMRKRGESHDPVYTLLDMGIVYQGRKEPELAYAHYAEALELSKKLLGENHEKTIWSYFTLADYYQLTKNYELAEEYFSKVIATLETINQSKNRLFFSGHLGLAATHFAQNHRSRALEHLQKCEGFIKATNQNAGSISIDELRIANLYGTYGETETAIVHYDKAIALETEDGATGHAIAFEAMVWKSFALEQLFHKTGKINLLYEAYEVLHYAQELRLLLLERAEILEDQLKNQQVFSNWSHHGQRIAYKLYVHTGEAKYLRTSWNYSELSKANVTLNAIQKSTELEKADVPAELLRTGADILNGINFYEQALYSAELSNDTLGMNRNQNLLFGFRQKNDSIQEIFKTQYPSFYRAKYLKEYQGLEETQQKLKKNQLLISYHLGDSGIYSFELSKDKFKLSKIDVDSTFKHTVYDFLNLIGEPKQSQSTFQEFRRLSGQIRQKLLPDAQKLGTYDELVIIPDNYLSLLPFETLITDNDNEARRFSDLNYLIKSHSISYANSATLLNQVKQFSSKSYKKSKVIAFAPVFDPNETSEGIKIDSSRSGLDALIWTKEEVSNISKYFRTDAHTGMGATERQFRQSNDQYDIVHIASHGLLNQENGLYSKLLFSPFNTDSINDGYMNTLELFNMKIPAEMVVLSACNSGIGDIITGEGVISLANGFFYAGSKSLVMSLWTANDQSTSTIIDSFYRELSHGRKKSDALRNAKLKFLEEADNLRAHPYYWAHLVVNGNNSPIVKNRSLWVYLTIAMVLIIAITARRRIKQRQLSRV